MHRSAADDWSVGKALALVAAVFAIVLGSLLPFAAMAAAAPGESLVLCSTEGRKVIHGGDVDGPAGDQNSVDCAACLIPPPASLPDGPVMQPVRSGVQPESVLPPLVRCPLRPPSRAPPRPPSTAPPAV